MRSLAAKLTLAFLIVGIAGALLVAVFMGRQTQRAFDRFVLGSYQRDIIERLAAYYDAYGSWDAITGSSPPRLTSPRFEGNHQGEVRDLFTVANAQGQVILSGHDYALGYELSENEMARAVPVEVNGSEVGWVLFAQQPERVGTVAGSLEANFLESMRSALIWGGLAATLVALILGAFLARTISHPIRELTGATQRMAAGELDIQVPVRTADEVGELAASFNQMSSDLSRVTRARRQMTADIAHDLRTPLSVILGYTEALSDEKLSGTPETYTVMYREALHLSHLIDDLRVLSLADMGELPLTRRPLAPLELLERAAAAHQPQASSKQIDLSVTAAPDLPLVEVDPERLAQVLNNLLSNALRHTPQNGRVTLAAAAQSGRVTLSVSDNGPGVPAADLPYIFNRFYRADEARQQNGESGLGLAIAKGIVQAHGGTITVDSPPGAGATFTVTLPAPSLRPEMGTKSPNSS
ncbi:MAG: ATP-binding protein [Candidatus Promineifilaceae bacterium]